MLEGWFLHLPDQARLRRDRPASNPPETLVGRRVDLWLLTHKDIRNVARLHVFINFIASLLKSQRVLPEGQRPQPPITLLP